jgi:hypothetical protein
MCNANSCYLCVLDTVTVTNPAARSDSPIVIGKKIMEASKDVLENKISDPLNILTVDISQTQPKIEIPRSDFVSKPQSLFGGPIELPGLLIHHPARPLGFRWTRPIPSSVLIKMSIGGTFELKCIHAHAGCGIKHPFCDKCPECWEFSKTTKAKDVKSGLDLWVKARR